MIIKGFYTVLNDKKLDIYNVLIYIERVKELINKIENEKENIEYHQDNVPEYEYKKMLKSYPKGRIINVKENKKYETCYYSVSAGSGCESEEKEGTKLVTYYSYDKLKKEVADLYILLNRLINKDMKAAYEILENYNKNKEDLETTKKKTQTLLDSITEELNDEVINELTNELVSLKEKKNGLVYYYSQVFKAIGIDYIKSVNYADLVSANERLIFTIEQNNAYINNCVNNYKDDALPEIKVPSKRKQ